MRVATINVPKLTNAGVPIPAVLDTTIDAILTKFGGATVADGFGCWRNPEGKVYREPMNIVTVAYDEDDNANDAALTKIAEAVAVDADQEAVYVVYANGTVAFVEQPKLAAAA